MTDQTSVRHLVTECRLDALHLYRMLYWLQFYHSCEMHVSVGVASASLCIPQSPNLATRQRNRKVTIPSQAALEEMELEEMKKLVEYFSSQLLTVLGALLSSNEYFYFVTVLK